MSTITTAMTDPEGTSIITGTILVTADDTEGTVLKGTSVTGTPGVSMTILAGTYRVHFTDAITQIKHYVGQITVVGDAALVDLLAA